MIIFIYGENIFQSRRKLNEFKERFAAKFNQGGGGLSIIDGETATLEKINEAIGSASLFSTRRLVIIENIFSNKKEIIYKQLLDYLKERRLDKISEDESDNIIIFWDNLSIGEKLPAAKNEFFKFLDKQKYRYPFKALTDNEAAAWTKKEIEKRGGKISQPMAAALSSMLDGDLWRINGEIEKLVNYKAGQKLKLADGEKGAVISEEDIKNLTHGKVDENIFALTDAIGNKNKPMAIKLLDEQIEAGLTDGYLLNMITRQFRIIMQIRQSLDKGLSPRQIAGELKLHPFVAQKGIAQARNFTMPILKNIFNKLVEIDFSIKTGGLDAKTGLGLLLAKM